jgi:hypothetical protein
MIGAGAAGGPSGVPLTIRADPRTITVTKVHWFIVSPSFEEAAVKPVEQHIGEESNTTSVGIRGGYQ